MMFQFSEVYIRDVKQSKNVIAISCIIKKISHN